MNIENNTSACVNLSISCGFPAVNSIKPNDKTNLSHLNIQLLFFFVDHSNALTLLHVVETFYHIVSIEQD